MQVKRSICSRKGEVWLLGPGCDNPDRNAHRGGRG